jgi:hypothetical protein
MAKTSEPNLRSAKSPDIIAKIDPTNDRKDP